MSIPRRPARPVNWVYSPGVIETCASPFHLVNFSRTTVLAGILIPSASVSVAKTAFTKPRLKRSSTAPLKLGRRPAWCAAIPRSKASNQSRYPRTSRSSSAKFWVYLCAVVIISKRSSALVNLIPACKHCLTAASQPALEKIKVIAGSRFSRCNLSMISARVRRFSVSPYLSRRPRGVFTRRRASRSRPRISGLTRPGSTKRSIKRLPMRTC